MSLVSIDAPVPVEGDPDHPGGENGGDGDAGDPGEETLSLAANRSATVAGIEVRDAAVLAHVSAPRTVSPYS
jgi:hypothetical protein